jgi:hypothetical protein
LLGPRAVVARADALWLIRSNTLLDVTIRSPHVDVTTLAN